MKSLSDKLSDASFPVWFTGVIDRIGVAGNVGEFQALLEEITEHLGAERSLFASVAGEAPNRSHAFVLGCNPCWWHRHRAIVAPQDDPWLAHALQTLMPALSSGLVVPEAMRPNALKTASTAGFASLVMIPTHSGWHENRDSVLCLGHSSAEYFKGPALPTLTARARSLTVELHHWWRGHDQSRLAASVRLSTSELQLLAHHCAGLRSKQIAQALGTNADAVDSRFHRIIAKLGVRNRQAAMQIALNCGLITR